MTPRAPRSKKGGTPGDEVTHNKVPSAGKYDLILCLIGQISAMSAYLTSLPHQVFISHHKILKFRYTRFLVITLHLYNFRIVRKDRETFVLNSASLTTIGQLMGEDINGFRIYQV